MYRMPFGRHEGQTLAEIPTGYLQWILREQITNPHWLLARVELELWTRRVRESGPRREEQQRRAETPPPRQDAQPRTGLVVADAVRRWFNKLALQYHPDRGGSDKLMGVINHAHLLLKEELKL